MSGERPPDRQEQQNRRKSQRNVKRVCHKVDEAKVSAGGVPRVGGGSTGNQNCPNRDCELAHSFSSRPRPASLRAKLSKP